MSKYIQKAVANFYKHMTRDELEKRGEWIYNDVLYYIDNSGEIIGIFVDEKRMGKYFIINDLRRFYE